MTRFRSSIGSAPLRLCQFYLRSRKDLTDRLSFHRLGANARAHHERTTTWNASSVRATPPLRRAGVSLDGGMAPTHTGWFSCSIVIPADAGSRRLGCGPGIGYPLSQE